MSGEETTTDQEMGSRPVGKDASMPFGADITTLAAMAPKSLDEFADIIGFEAAVRLCEYYRGRDKIYIPEKIEDSSQLVKAIGLEAAKRLSEAMPRENLAISSISERRLVSHRQQIAILESGLSVREAARKYGVTPRWVRHLRQKAGLSRPKSFRKEIAQRLEGVEKVDASLISALAKEIGCSEDTVGSVVVSLGLKRERDSYISRVKRRLAGVDRLGSGLVSIIASEIGCSEVTVRQAAAQIGFKKGRRDG